MVERIENTVAVGTIVEPFTQCRVASGFAVYRSILAINRGNVTSRVYIETVKACIYNDTSLVGQKVTVFGDMRSHRIRQGNEEHWYACLFVYDVVKTTGVDDMSEVILNGTVCADPVVYPKAGKPENVSVCITSKSRTGKSYGFQLTSNLFKFMRRLRGLQKGSTILVRGFIFSLNPEKVLIGINKIEVLKAEGVGNKVDTLEKYNTELDSIADTVADMCCTSEDLPYDV